MEELSDEEADVRKNEIFSVPSIGELTLRLLIKEGYDSLDKLKSASSEDIYRIDHIGEIQAHRIKIEIEEGQKRFENKKEIKCPNCGNFVFISKQSCSECGKGFTSVDQEIILPGGKIVEDPLRELANIEEKLMDGEEDEDVWYGKGAILESMGALEKAYEAYDKVIEFDPLYDWIWNAKASLAMKLGKFEEATRAYKVAVDFRTDTMYFKGLQERVEEEEEPIPTLVIEEHAIDVEEIEEKVIKARQILHQIDLGHFDIAGVEELLNKATRARNKDNRERAVEYAEKVIDVGNKIEDLLPTIEKIEENIADLDDSHEGLAIYIERYKELKKRIADWTFLEHPENVDDLRDDLNGILNALSAWEVYIDRFDKAKRVLAETRGTKLNLDKIKTLVRDALKAEKEGKFNIGLDIIDEMMECLDKVNEIHMKIQDAKELIIELNELGIDVKGLIKDIKRVRDTAEKGEYDDSIEMLDEVTARIKDEIDGAEKPSEEVREETSEEGEELKRRIEETKERFSDIKKGPVKVEKINKAIDEIIQDEEAGKYVDGLGKIRTVNNDIDGVEHLVAILETAMEKIEELKSSGVDHKEFVKELREGKKKADLGEYGKAADICEEVLGNLDDELECIIDIGDLKEPLDKKTIDDKMSELKSLIIFARTVDIPVEKAGEIINMAVKSTRKEEFDAAGGYLDEGLSWIRNKLDERSAEIIESVEDTLQYSDEGEPADDANRYLAQAKEERKVGNIKKTFTLLAKAEIRGEEAKGDAAIASDSIKYMEDIMDVAGTMDLDTGDAPVLLKDAQKAFSKGDWEEAIEYTEKAKETAFENIRGKISSMIDDAQRELKEAKISGLNISKPIHLIKEVRKAEAQSDLETSLKYLKTYKEYMQSVSE